MATTKSSTRRPTKKTNSKKRAVASAAKTKRPVRAKAVTKKITVKKQRTQVLSFNNLLLLTVVLFLSAVFALYILVPAVMFTLSITHVTTDTFLAGDTNVFSPAYRALFDLDLRWDFTALAVLSLLYPLLRLTRMQTKAYDADSTLNKIQWADLSVSGAIMVAVVALLSGYSNLIELKLIAALVLITGLLSFYAQGSKAIKSGISKHLYRLALLTGAVAWLPVISSFIHTQLYGGIRLTWFVYVLAGAALVGFIASSLELKKSINSGVVDASLERRLYVIASVTKVLFITTFIVGHL